MEDFAEGWEKFECAVEDVRACAARRVPSLREAHDFYNEKIEDRPTCGKITMWCDETARSIRTIFGTEESFSGWLRDGVIFLNEVSDGSAVVVWVPRSFAPACCAGCVEARELERKGMN